MRYGSLPCGVGYTVVLIKLPLLPEPCRLLDSACRKLASLVLASAVLVLPPPSLSSRFLNELSSDEVASLLLVPVVLVVSVLSVLVSLLKLELADSLVIRLCRSDSSLAGPPPKPPPCPCDGSPYCVDELLDALPLLLCECSAAIRLCRKLPIACCAESVLSVLLVSVLLVDAALLSVLPELLELSVTPIAESALAIALAKPPPPPGGGGGGPSGIPLVPLVPLALVLLELP